MGESNMTARKTSARGTKPETQTLLLDSELTSEILVGGCWVYGEKKINREELELIEKFMKTVLCDK
jgi:hypothetical protein